MGKKGTKRKTQWRTLSITEQDEINMAAAISSKGNYNNGINIDEASSVDDNYKYSGTNYSYLKRKSSSFNSSSNLNNNNNYNNINIYNKNRNEYRNSDSNLNSYYNSNKQHNNNDTNINNSNLTTTANRTNNTTPTNNQNYNYNSNNHNYNISRYSYRRRPYSMQQNGGIGSGSSSSSKYYSSYGAGRATSRSNRSYNDSITATSNKENDYPKPCFNEDEYTRITTPRQDVIFKKGYFSRPRPYLSSNTDTNTTSSAAASVVSNEELMSATSVPSSLSPEQCSSSQSDSIPDQEHAFMYSYVDQNGIVYVNPYMPNGFDQYSGQMFMMPYGYSPYNIYPPDINTPPLNETEIDENDNEVENNDKETTDSDDKKISDNLSNEDKQIENETNEIKENSKSDLDNCDSVDDTSNTEESSIEPKDDTIENKDEGYINENYTNINNHCQPNFINLGGFGGQYYPPMFYPLNMYGGPPMMPIIGGPNFDAPINIVEQNDDEDGDDSDQSTNCTQANRNKSRRDIHHIHRNSTGATTTDYSEDDCSDNYEVNKTLSETADEKQTNTKEDKQILLSENETCDIKLVDGVNKTNDNEISSLITQETDNKHTKFNANVEEFKPRNVVETANNKPHLNVNVKEFLPRSYQNDSSSSQIDHHNTALDVTKTSTNKLESISSPAENRSISVESSEKICVINNEIQPENVNIQQQQITNKKINESVSKPKVVELTLAEKIKLSLAEENQKRLQQQSIIKEVENIRKIDSKQILRDSTKKNINKTNKKLDKSSALKINKKKPIKQDTTIKAPESPSKTSISLSTELTKANNVLSYAQMVNKDLHTKSPNQNTNSTTTPQENNPANNIINNNQNTKDIDDDIDIQILLKSLDAADNLTATKENISWQTVKPKGKRGKSYKDDEFEDTEQEHFIEHEVNDSVEVFKKTKPLSTEIKTKPIVVVEELVKIEEPEPNPIEKQPISNEEINSTSTVTKPEKKKSKTKAKKSSSSLMKKTSKISKSNKNDEKIDENNEIEANDVDKTDKHEEDATNLARRLFEEIDLSLKTTQKESVDDDDLILGEIYSPNSSLMNKSFGRNSLDMMNGGFDYKFKNTSILKEEEEMVLNVIKSLSSNSNSASPIGGSCSSKNTFNIFNASFLEGIGKTAQMTNDFTNSVLKKNSTTENIEKLIENNDEKPTKLSTSEKKHNKLGTSKKGGKNIEKIEGKNKVGKKSKSLDTKNNVSQLSDKTHIIDNTESSSFSSPETNADENIIDSSEYIKNCIQESFKWIEKSNIPKFTKTIEEHLIKPSTNDQIEIKETEIDNRILNDVADPSEIVIKTSINATNCNNAFEGAYDQIFEEALPEECIVADTDNISFTTDFQNNENVHDQICEMPTANIILVEDSITINNQENCQENTNYTLIEELNIENECNKNEHISVDCLNSEISETINEVETDFTQKCLVKNMNSVILQQNFGHYNGVSELNSAKSESHDHESTTNVEMSAEKSHNAIEKSELPNFTKSMDHEDLTDICFENGVNHFHEEIANIQEVNKNTQNCLNKFNGYHHNGDDTNEYDKRTLDTISKLNGFYENDEITQNNIESNHTENIISNNFEEDKPETVPFSKEINTQITPLNSLDSNSNVSINLTTDLSKLYEIIDNKSESNEDINPRKFERESSTSSSTSLEIQLKQLQEQLLKFDEISIKPLELNDNGKEDDEILLINHNGCEQNNITTSHSCIDQITSNPNKLTQNKLELENFCDNPETNTQIMATISTTSTIIPPTSPDISKNSLIFPQKKTELVVDSLEKFPLTQAIKLWLDSESKENSPEPLLRIPDDPILSSFIKSSISQQSLDQFNNYDNDYDINDDDDDGDDDDDDDTWSINDENKLNDEIIIKQNNGVIKNDLNNSKNLKSNPLHVSSVNKETSLIIDNDSDYNSDSQHKYDDDNTCKRVAKNFSDLVKHQQQQNDLIKCDLLEYWDDEFIENPKKWLNLNQKNDIINNNNNETVLSSGCPSTSSQNDLNNILPYESVYGKTIDYNQLLSNNYEFLSNNIINLNNNNHIDDNDNNIDNNHHKILLNNDKIIIKNNNNNTSLNKNNNNNFNINNNNFDNINNKSNCLKPPEVCCILM